MPRPEPRIICDSARAPASTRTVDGHDNTSHHRYYGSSVTNGGERLAETRSGERPRKLNVCGF
jgi:hypothetical protein